MGLGWLTHWDVRYEMVFSFLLAVLVLYNIYRLSNTLKIEEPWQKWLLLCLASLFVFSPIQYENWLFGVQIEYFMPVACITSCMAIIYSGLRNGLKLAFCLALAVVSTYSSVNGLLCWLVILPVFLLSNSTLAYFKGWLPLTVWLSGACMTITFYFTGYESPANFPSPFESLHHPLDAVLYFLGLMGNPFRMVHALKPIIVVGSGLVALFGLMVAYIIWHWKDKTLLTGIIPWVMLGLYSVMTAAMVMTGRLGFGLFQSLTSRYTTYTLYLPVALLMLVFIISRHLAVKAKLKALPDVLLVIMTVFIFYVKADTFTVAVNDLKNYHHNIRHAKAALLFVNFIPHQTCESKIYLVHYKELCEKANTLNKLGYLQPPLIETNLLHNIGNIGNENSGTFDALIPVNDTLYEASGLLLPTPSGFTPDAVLLTYDDTLAQPVVFALYNADNLKWTKSFSLNSIPPVPATIRAWSFNTESGKVCSLKGSHIIERP